MDFAFTEEQNLLRDSVRAMMDRVATPEYVRRCDAEPRYPYELYDAFVEMGLLRMPFPESVGGLGGSVIDFAVIAEELGRKSYDFLGAYGTCVFNGLNILHNGTEAQRAHWLPKLLDGSIRMSISMTEPGAGSDAGAMRTSARRDGDMWVINGQKVFSTGAGADKNVINLYARNPKGRTSRRCRCSWSTRTLRASRCTSWTRSAAAPWAPTRCSSTMCACPPTAWWASRTRAGATCCRACSSNA